jgi:hypothetical protein
MGIHRNPHGHVQASPSWHSCKQTPQETTQRQRVLPMPTHTRSMVAIWCDIIFCLVVDNFGIKTTSIDDITHLKATLEEHYTVAIDWNGSLFCGVNLDWNYPAYTVKLNMPKYIPKALLKFQHTPPTKPQHQPYKHVPIQYGSRVQRVDTDTTNKLSPTAIERVQDIVGTLLYYGCAIDPPPTHRAQLHCCMSVQRHSHRRRILPPTPRLRCDTPQRKHTIQSMQHDPCRAYRRFIPVQTNWQKPSLRPFLPDKPR